jgi:hypothetical protein
MGSPSFNAREPVSFFAMLSDPDAGTLAGFLEAWHGPPSRPAGPVQSGNLPRAILELAALADRWDSVFVQNRLELDPEWARDGEKRVFYVENQSVFVWATDGVGPDPTVWGRLTDDGERWLAEREPLSRFLVQIAVFEAIMGTPHGAAAAWLSLEQVNKVIAPLRRLDLGSWRWPSEPSWFYASDEALALVNPNSGWPSHPSDRYDVIVAARSERPLAYLSGIEDADWAREPQ